MKFILPLLCFFLLITGCSQDRKPKLSYNEKELQILDSSGSSNPILSALPVEIDSIDYILHPIGEFSVNESYSRWSEFGSSGSGSGSTSQSGYFNGDSYNGNLTNVKFQHITSDSLSALTDKIIRINSFSFLRKLSENTGKDFLLYMVNDKDSNKDGKIDSEDINTLYLSSVSGKDFKKILPTDHELMGWRIISTLNRLYFRSIEDSNRNGEFEKDDKLHYYYIDFNTRELEVVEHFPV